MLKKIFIITFAILGLSNQLKSMWDPSAPSSDILPVDTSLPQIYPSASALEDDIELSQALEADDQGGIINILSKNPSLLYVEDLIKPLLEQACLKNLAQVIRFIVDNKKNFDNSFIDRLISLANQYGNVNLIPILKEAIQQKNNLSKNLFKSHLEQTINRHQICFNKKNYRINKHNELKLCDLIRRNKFKKALKKAQHMDKDDINLTEPNGSTALLEAALIYKHKKNQKDEDLKELIKTLSRNGANIYLPNTHSVTPMELLEHTDLKSFVIDQYNKHYNKLTIQGNLRSKSTSPKPALSSSGKSTLNYKTLSLIGLSSFVIAALIFFKLSNNHKK